MYCPWEYRNNIILIGNKIDLDAKRQVTVDQACELCHRLELQDYVETSASTNHGVDQAFYFIALKAFEITKQQELADGEDSGRLKKSNNGRTNTSLQLN